MKLGNLAVFAFFLPGLMCVGQSSDPAGKPAEQTAPPAAPAAEQTAPPPAPAPASAPAIDQAPGVPATTLPAAVQTPAAAAADQAPAPAVSSGSYVIGASDVLTVTVWKEPTLSGSLLVRPDGMVSVPLLGDVQASGLTPEQLADQVATKLKKFVQDPNVSVLISQIHSKVIYLLGEIAKRGPVDMTPGMTLLQAISSAGGLTDYANTKKMYSLRNEAGRHEKIPVHYKQALKGDSTLDLPLKPGDTIVAP
jgi:polysaccharide export outer membrane protein